MSDTAFTLAFTLETLARFSEAAKAKSRIHPLIMDGRKVYLMTITDRMRAVLVMVKAKARWKEQHRAARIAKALAEHEARLMQLKLELINGKEQ